MRISKYLMKLILVSIMVSSLALTAYAGTTGKISGTVIDSDTGEPLIGVNIVITGTRLGAATDINGRYTILNIPPGTYTVSGSFIGFKQLKIENVRVSIDLTTKLNFELISSSIEGEEVIVISERPLVTRDRTSSEVHISADELTFTPIQEVTDILQTKAGITKDAGGGLHIRGGRSNEIVYWVDGIPVTDVFDGGSAVEIEKSSIQELQLVTGTFNAEYGQAMSGIVNIITKSGGESLRGSMTFYAGDYYSRDNAVFFNLDKLNLTENYNIQGSLSGPVPVGNNLVSFYVNGRVFSSDGYLYGAKEIDLSDAISDTVEKDDPILSDLGYYEVASELDDGRVALIYKPIPEELIAPMNWEEKSSMQGKLSFYPTNNLNFHLNYIYNKRDFQDYNQALRLNTVGDVNKFDRGNTLTFSLNHALSSKSFYTIKASKFESKFWEYLYEDPLDSRYQDPTITTNLPLFSFDSGGTNPHHFERRTGTNLLKADFTSQLNSYHELKIGTELRRHDLFFDDFWIVPKVDDTGAIIEPYEPDTLDVSAPNHRRYSKKPVEYSGYIQDKIEYESMIVNIGLRFDYFNSNGNQLVDTRNPNVYNPFSDYLVVDGDSIYVNPDNTTLEFRKSVWYKDVPSNSRFSPRIGIAFPITDKGVIHFSYGHFLQIPAFSFLFDNPEWKLSETGAVQGPYGNASLKPQRTVKYEIGLQQEVFTGYSVEVAGYYQDIRDLVTSGVVKETAVAGVSWIDYVNRDYANTRGISLVLQRRMINHFGFNIDYTFQVAEGSNSDPNAQFFAVQSNQDPVKTITPLDWDQNHTLNASVVFGGQDWSLSFLGQYGSGLPYTPFIQVSTRTGRNVATSLPENSRTKPSTFNIDLQTHKSFSLAGLNGKIFLRVFNVFDTRNAVNVFTDTGLPDISLNTGNVAEISSRPNTVGQFNNFPTFYSPPRKIQWGVDLFF